MISIDYDDNCVTTSGSGSNNNTVLIIGLSNQHKNWWLRDWSCWSVMVAVIGVAILYVIPAPIDPEPVNFNTTLPILDGVLSINDHLSHAQKLFEGQIIGPESFAAGSDGSIYTGTADGKVWKIKNGQLQLLTRTGIEHKDCGSYDLEPECGRPKGMKVDSQGRLVLVDCYKGLLRVDVHSGQTEVLLDSFESKKFVFLNDLDIAKDGTIYFTDSSTKWERRDYRYEVIESNKLGRILAYDPDTKRAWLVRDGLYLANGLVLSKDESYLLVAEMTASRISKVYLKGIKSGQSEILSANLPGYPDNIEPNSRGNFYIAFGSVRFQGVSLIGCFLDNVGNYPFIKRLLTKLIPKAAFDLFLPKHSLFLEMNTHGKIVSSHHDPGAKVFPALSEGYEHNGYIYFGNFKLNFIGFLKITHLHPEKQ